MIVAGPMPAEMLVDTPSESEGVRSDVMEQVRHDAFPWLSLEFSNALRFNVDFTVIRTDGAAMSAPDAFRLNARQWDAIPWGLNFGEWIIVRDRVKWFGFEPRSRLAALPAKPPWAYVWAHLKPVLLEWHTEQNHAHAVIRHRNMKAWSEAEARKTGHVDEFGNVSIVNEINDHRLRLMNSTSDKILAETEADDEAFRDRTKTVDERWAALGRVQAKLRNAESRFAEEYRRKIESPEELGRQTKLECRRRITRAYGEKDFQSEIELRLRNGHTESQDTERDRLLAKCRSLVQSLRSMTDEQRAAFDPKSDSNWM